MSSLCSICWLQSRGSLVSTSSIILILPLRTSSSITFDKKMELKQKEFSKLKESKTYKIFIFFVTFPWMFTSLRFWALRCTYIFKVFCSLDRSIGVVCLYYSVEKPPEAWNSSRFLSKKFKARSIPQAEDFTRVKFSIDLQICLLDTDGCLRNWEPESPKLCCTVQLSWKASTIKNELRNKEDDTNMCFELSFLLMTKLTWENKKAAALRTTCQEGRWYSTENTARSSRGRYDSLVISILSAG